MESYVYASIQVGGKGPTLIHQLLPGNMQPLLDTVDAIGDSSEVVPSCSLLCGVEYGMVSGNRRQQPAGQSCLQLGGGSATANRRTHHKASRLVKLGIPPESERPHFLPCIPRNCLGDVKGTDEKLAHAYNL